VIILLWKKKMSKEDKDIEKIKNNPKGVRFEILDKVLRKAGFKTRQPCGGSNHYTYKKGYSILAIPKYNPVTVALITIFCSFFLLSSPASAQWCDNWPIWLNASYGDYDGVKRCLEEGYPATIGALAEAAKNRHLNIMELLLAYGVDPNERIDRSTLLIEIARLGYADEVNLLIKNGANVNAQSDRGTTTALIEASAYGHLEVVKLLIAAGADLDFTKNRKGTALTNASYAGHIEIVKMLLQNGANVNTTTDKSCLTPLVAAIVEEHKEIAKLLLEYKPVTNIVYVPPDHLVTHALWAARSNSELLELILKKGRRVEKSSNPNCQVYLERIKIGKLRISYANWAVYRNELQYNLKRAEEKLIKVEETHQKMVERAREASNKLYELEAQESELEEKLERLFREKGTVDPSLKTPEYERIEKRIAYIEKRMETIAERVEHIKKNMPDTPPEVILSLTDEYEVLKRELPKKKKELGRLEKKLGIEKKRREELKKTDDNYWKVKRDIMRAGNEQAIAGSLTGHLLDDYFKAANEYDKVSLAFIDLKKTGTPLITEIREKNGYYQALLWTPKDTLKKLNARTAELEALLRKLDKRRAKYRGALILSGDKTTRKGSELVTATWESMLGQAAVEWADFGIELFKGAKEGGLLGAAAAAVKSAIDLAFSGVPNYYDAKFDLSDQLAMACLDGAKGSPGTIVKTAMGNTVDVMVNSYLASQEKEVLEELWKTLLQGSWYTDRLAEVDPDFHRRFIEDLPRMILDREQTFNRAEKIFKDSLKSMELKSMFKDAAKGLVKGVAKEALKKEIAEFFEGRAMREYMQAQYELQGNARLLLQASNHWWTTKDLYDALRATRDAFIKNYDPASSMKVKKSEVMPFTEEYKPYELLLSDRNSDPYRSSKREIEVIIGGVKAERDKSGALIFRVPADKLGQIDYREREGGARLNINILK